MLHVQKCPKGNQHRARSQSPHYVILNGDRHWIQVSQQSAAHLGYKPEELEEKTAEQLMPPNAKYDSNVFDSLLENESLEVQFTFQRKVGKVIVGMASLSMLEDGCILGVARLL